MQPIHEGASGEGALDLHQAARMLDRTSRRAQRELDFRSPWLTLLAAAAALIAFGSATATMVVLGTFGAARAAARENWQELGIWIAVLIVAAISAFAGPRGVWLSNGVGLCVVLVAYSAVEAWMLRTSRSDG